MVRGRQATSLKLVARTDAEPVETVVPESDVKEHDGRNPRMRARAAIVLIALNVALWTAIVWGIVRLLS